MSPILGIYASQDYVRIPPSSYESIATATGTGSSGTITFSSIPSTYQHLQIRYIAKDTRTGTNDNLRIRLNNDTSTNYARHTLRGTGATVDATASTSATWIDCNNAIADTPTGTTNMMGVGILDLHDYASTTKNKTLRIINGFDYNYTNSTDGIISLYSGLWMSTSAVNRIDLISSGTAFNTSSVFSLYGIKG